MSVIFKEATEPTLLVTPLSCFSGVGDKDCMHRILATPATKLVGVISHLSTGLKLILHESAADWECTMQKCTRSMVGTLSLDNGAPLRAIGHDAVRGRVRSACVWRRCVYVFVREWVWVSVIWCNGFTCKFEDHWLAHWLTHNDLIDVATFVDPCRSSA